MVRLIKYVLKAIFPPAVLDRIWRLPSWFSSVPARFRFATARLRAQFLGWEELDRLQKKYPYPVSISDPDPEAGLEEGRRLAKRLLSAIGDPERTQSFLETGAGNGFVSLALKEMGKDVCALDARGSKVDEQVLRAGVDFLEGDVMDMPFEDGSFDCVVSFNAFEHFMDPDKAVREMLRVLRKDGLLYLDFGPLYYAPFGLHIYKCISVPYSQFLFDYDMMMEYIEKNDLRRPVVKTLSKWSVRRYQQLWRSVCGCADIVYMEKIRGYEHLDLVCRYAGLFKAQTSDFEDLVVKQYRIIFQKK